MSERDQGHGPADRDAAATPGTAPAPARLAGGADGAPPSAFERHFDALVDAMPALAGRDAQWSLELRGESSDFVRLNHGAIRQPGRVRRAEATLRLIDGRRHARRAVALSGDVAEDRERVADALRTLHALLPALPDDPLCTIETRPVRSRRVERIGPAEGTAPGAGTGRGSAHGPAHDADGTARAIVADVTRAARGLDLVGLLTAGPRVRGVANAHGVRHWHEVDGHSLDLSLHHDTGALRGRAAKASLHGRAWDVDAFARRLDALRRDHALLARPARRVPAGDVRAFLTPHAVDALLGLAAWGGFSAAERQARRSPLQRLADGERAWSPQVTLADDVRDGDAPAFDADGFARAAPLTLVERGVSAGACCSARTGAEYGIAHTGADGERPEALAMAAGDLDDADAMRALGTGLWVSRLWYLNWSDRESARATGMTRFATWWVEDGVPVAPVEPMRFDDSLDRTFGPALEALTRDRTLVPDDSTYDERSMVTTRVPGMLLSDWRLVG